MANGKTLSPSINEDELVRLAQALSSFSTAADALRKRIVTLFQTKYGGDLWWEKEEAKVDEQLKNDQYRRFSSMSDAITYLKSL